VGRRGPQPLDSETLRRRGSNRWKARAAEERAAAERIEAKAFDPIEPPAWLNNRAKAIWKTADAFLLGDYPTVDVPLLASFCACYSDLIAAQEMIQAEGLVITSERGRCKHPATSIINANRVALVRLGSALGFSPAARQSLGWHVEGIGD